MSNKNKYAKSTSVLDLLTVSNIVFFFFFCAVGFYELATINLIAAMFCAYASFLLCGGGSDDTNE